MAESNREKGLKKRAELFGERDSLERIEQLRQFDEGFARLLTDVCFGDVWSRPGLPTKIRSMITVAALITLGRLPELKNHMVGALRAGVTEQELKEIVVHLSQYAGIPAAVQAVRVFNDAQREFQKLER